MSETKIEKPKAKVEKINSNFSYRNIKKEFNKPTNYNEISRQYHLELAEKGSTVVVRDRDRDWLELHNKDVDKVGLTNILELARRRGELSIIGDRYSFKDNEAIDTTIVDPLKPETIDNLQSNVKADEEKLDSIAKTLGVTRDELIKSLVDGKLSDLFSAKTKVESKEEGGKVNE